MPCLERSSHRLVSCDVSVEKRLSSSDAITHSYILSYRRHRRRPSCSPERPYCQRHHPSIIIIIIITPALLQSSTSPISLIAPSLPSCFFYVNRCELHPGTKNMELSDSSRPRNTQYSMHFHGLPCHLKAPRSLVAGTTVLLGHTPSATWWFSLVFSTPIKDSFSSKSLI